MDAIVFDLFHTLVDPEDYRPKDFRRSEYVADAIGIERDPFWDWWQETIYPRLTGVTTLTDEVVAYASSKGVAASREDVDRAIFESGRYQRKALDNPRGEVLSALGNIKSRSISIGLLSNAEEWEMRTFETSPLNDLIDAATHSFQTAFAKPDLEAYVDIIRKLEADPASSIYVANGWDQELDGARNAGFGLVVFMRGFVGTNGLSNPDELQALAAEADETIDDLAELLDLI
jgi:FMN phosphatase YigB (HAD superfamily)